MLGITWYWESVLRRKNAQQGVRHLQCQLFPGFRREYFSSTKSFGTPLLKSAAITLNLQIYYNLNDLIQLHLNEFYLESCSSAPPKLLFRKFSMNEDKQKKLARADCQSPSMKTEIFGSDNSHLPRIYFYLKEKKLKVLLLWIYPFFCLFVLLLIF